MKKISAATILLMALFASCKKKDSPSDPVAPPVKQVDIAALNSKLTSFMSTYNIPGASLAVTKNGKLVYVKGFGKANITYR